MELQPELIGPGDSSQKICAVCGVVKPATAFYFQKDVTTDDGWCAKCKECRNKYKQQLQNREIAANLAHLQTNLLTNIEQGGGRALMCDLETGGEYVLQAFGGIEGFAQKLAADYAGMPIGTHGRTKILLGALAFVQKAMEKRPSIKVDSMDDETLKAALRDALGDDYRRIVDESSSPPVDGAE